MPRHDPSPLSERLTGADRLAALRLAAGTSGWVPETAERVETSSAAEPLPPSMPSPLVATPTELFRGWVKDRTPPWAHGVLDRATVGSVLTGIATMVAVLVAVVMVVHRHVAAVDNPSYSSSASGTFGGSTSDSSYPASSPAPVTTDVASIVVDVGGRVRKPGLVTLPSGARVADAIAAAGGPLRHRELATTNLAARVTDGQLLVIGAKPVTADAGGADPSPTSPSSAAPIDLNAATLEQLETLPGVGPVTGQKIIDWRTAHSGFTAVEQLQQVSGIGPATYAELSPLVAP